MPKNSPPLQSILVMAPQPFFQNRGTPIAVRLLVAELALLGYSVDLLVFHEGDDVDIPGVRLHRTLAVTAIKNIPPSLSWKKIACDILMFFSALRLMRRNRYDLIHAVEEASFMALVLKKLCGVPYVYDMDSSLAMQIVDKLPFMRPLRSGLEFFEKGAVRESIGVVAVCKALEDMVQGYAPGKHVVRLEDISLLEDTVGCRESLRESCNLSGPIMLYVGNLEGYQGIDLLLKSFQRALQNGCRGNVVIIGGSGETIAFYRKMAENLGIADNTCFCGPRPVERLGHYLAQADILLSPRIHGNNTPMKLYSYLDSGKVVLATNLATHTQVLDDSFSCLVDPDTEAMAAGMCRLLGDPELCRQLGERGRQVARQNYSLEAYRRKLEDFYRTISKAHAE